MKTRKVAAVSTCAFLLALLQLVASLTNFAVGAVGGAAIGFCSAWLLNFFDIELSSAWMGVALPTLSSSAGVAAIFFPRGAKDALLWVAPLLALVVSAGVVGLRQVRSKRCALCERRLRGGVAFECPRCCLVVCDSCWVFERIRCRLCYQNHVPILPPDARWWDKRFGPRTTQGRCQVCMATAQEVDLRPCGKCGRPQCRDCWDNENGQCSRCKWIVDDLPLRLQTYMIPRPRS